MYSVSELQNIINNEIDRLDYLGRKPHELYEPVCYALNNGGKRLRPLLTLMGCNLLSKEIETAVKPALAFEVFHNFTLLHDDIMDNAAVRRNKPTVHKKWDPNTAILSGDAMLILAYELLSGVPGNFLKESLDIFNKTALEVCEGQQYDMNFEKAPNTTENEYLEMIRLKTSVLMAASLQLGALLGGASVEERENIYLFGQNLGMAFQLQDDFLDTYGDEKTFGKQIGGDIVMNKKTFLLVKTIELAKESDIKKLKHLLFEENEPSKKIAGVKSIYERVNVAGITQKKISEYFTAALKSMDKIKVPDNRKTPLLDLTNNMFDRRV